MACVISKAMLWSLLDDKALSFSGWLISGDPAGAAMKVMLDNTESIDIESTLVYNQLIPLLISKGILVQADVTRFDAYIANSKLPPSFGQ